MNLKDIQNLQKATKGVTMEELSNFPKILCPFIRQDFNVDLDDFKKYGNKYMLRNPQAYLVVDKINPGFEWVFDDPDTIAVEKLDGTNIKLKTEEGRLVSLMNRKNVIDPLQVISGKTFIIEGVFRAIGKGYVEKSREQAGECIGPKLQGNPYKLDNHEWYPFDRAIKYLRYNSFHEHDRTFLNWSEWFKNYLHSRYYQKIASKKGITNDVFAEGVVFYNLKRKEKGLSWMAKLRRNMFDWYYSPEIKIIDYDKNGYAD